MAEHTAQRIQQQVNVCGIMNIGFNDKRITAPAQGLARLFPTTVWPLSTINWLTFPSSSRVSRLTLSTSV